MRRIYQTSTAFPVEEGEEWDVRNGDGKIVERWRIIKVARPGGSFTADINVIVAED